MIHRIPYPKGRSYGPTGLPVFLHHGIAESSADWLLLPSNKSLGNSCNLRIALLVIIVFSFYLSAFQLADLGYDVWLGNCRGNTYSRGHVTLDASRDKTYWDFSYNIYFLKIVCILFSTLSNVSLDLMRWGDTIYQQRSTTFLVLPSAKL